MTNFDLVVNTPVGKVGINLDGKLAFDVTLQPEVSRAKTPAQYAWLKEWLDAYFEDASNWSALPVSLSGTDYQQRVWSALRELGSGEVVTYGELAKSLGSGPRAIGQACRTNPCPLLVPCHRVVAANGRGGFHGHTNGSWPQIKSWLLKHEGVEI
jgi:methylated-DNA-[protein]-cysteine S-methyltransferase